MFEARLAQGKLLKQVSCKMVFRRPLQQLTLRIMPSNSAGDFKSDYLLA
jgi:hypothetical protein